MVKYCMHFVTERMRMRYIELGVQINRKVIMFIRNSSHLKYFYCETSVLQKSIALRC